MGALQMGRSAYGTTAHDRCTAPDSLGREDSRDELRTRGSTARSFSWSEAILLGLCAFSFLLSTGESAAAPDSEAATSATEEPPLELGLDPDVDEDIVFQEIPSVFGVSRFEQKVTEAPSFVTLITSDEIEKFGYRTLGEALASVTGFFTTYDRNYLRLGVRGFNRPGDFNSRVLLLVDGHRLNDNLYDQAGLGTESLVDVDLIDRVEVIRGPSSSLYGTNAFFGVINVITKRGRDIKGAELSVEAASFDTWRVRGTYGDKFANGLELILSGSYYDSSGQALLFYPEFDDPATNNGYTRHADYDNFPTFFGKLSFRDFTLQGGLVSREKGIPTAAYGTVFPTSETNSLDEHSYIFLKYEHQFASQLNVYGRVYYDRFYYRGNYLYDVPPDLVLNRDRSTGEWWGFETKVDKRVFDSHKLTGGIEFRQHFRQDLWNADVDPPPTIVYLDEERDTWDVAAFLQWEWSIIDNLILNAGVRFDYFESFGDTWNPRAALIYNLQKTTFKVLYGSAFRGPNAYERFYEGTGFQPNPDLGPERVQTTELVVEHRLNRNFQGTVAGYYYWINDLVDQHQENPPGGPIIWKNRGKTQALGLELQMEMADWSRFGLDGRLGYALQRAEDRLSGERLTNSPTHKLNFNLTAPFVRDQLFGSFELLYLSGRDTLAGDKTDDHTITNLTLFNKNSIEGLEISASVKNLFDEKYSDPGSSEQVQDQIEQDGRTFWFKIKYGF